MNVFKTLTVDGQTYAIDKDIDDSTLGDKGWSSRKIVEMLCPEFSVQGQVATCYPVAGYPLSVTTQVEQAGTVRLHHTGKNLFNGFWESGRINTSTGANYADSKSVRTGYIPVLPGCQYRFTLQKLSNNYPVVYDQNKEFVRYMGLKSGSFTFTPDEGEFFLRVAQLDCTEPFAQAQLELGNVSTDFVPYEGAEHSRTVSAGGSYDWQTGCLTDENGEQLEKLEPVVFTGVAGVNVFAATGENTVSGRADIKHLLTNL